MFPDRLPRPLRLTLYAAASAVLLWLCLAPTQTLPSANMGDKIEHTIAWLVLTSLGLGLSHQRPRAIAAYALGLGALIEVLQATLGFGRQGDWRDLLADAIGVALALAGYALIRRFARP